MLEKDFLSPPSICRGTDFWMLNDELNEEELCRQLRSMHEQGVACVIVRTYIGLRSDYPGRDWKKKMHVIIGEAKKLGMTLFMQAGYMPEAVLDLPEEFSLGDLRCCPAGQGTGEVLDSHDGIDYCLVSSKTILDMLDPDACAFYVRQSYENMWGEFREEFGKTIVSMWVDEPSFRKVSLPWTGILPKTYEALWGEAFPMNKVHLLFVDGEGDRLLRLRYWRTVLHLMKNAYFKSVRDWGRANHIQFSGHLMEEDNMEMQICATCFTMPMYKYFDIPGIDFLTAQFDWVHGEIKPETAYETRWANYGRYNTPLQCSSAAHQAGREIVLAEMYGVSSENLGLRDQKQMFDHFASLGINHRSVHGLFYSLRGRGKRAFPPHVHDYQPYWPKYHLLTDAIARESVFVRSGKPVRDAVLLHPIETGFSLYHGKDCELMQNNHELRRRDAFFNQTIRTLVGMQANFELGDEDTIAEMGSVSAEGEFVIGEMAYRSVILPDMDFIRESTLAQLQAFSEKGGRILVYGKRPSRTDAGRRCDLAELKGVCFADSARGLSEFIGSAPKTYRFEKRNDDTGVQIFCRKSDGDLLFFLTNANCRKAASGRLIVPGKYACERFMEFDGSVIPCGAELEEGSTAVPIELPEGGTLLLRFRAGQPEAAEAVSPRAVLPLKAKWKFRREDPNALVIEMFRFAREGEELSDQPYPILAIQDILLREKYTGTIALQASFELKKALKGLRLALEYPEQQEICIDGAKISSIPDGRYRTFGFETLPLPDLDAGRHTLTVRRHFAPMRKPKSSVTSLFENLGGVDLEQMMLIGDFAVRSAVEPSIHGCVRMSEDFVLTEEDEVCGEELIQHGYPFYAGVMSMTTEIEVPEGAEQVELTLEGLHAAVAEVLVNGELCGEFCWAPYTVELKNLHAGRNTLTIRLFGTLRNLLGPWHRPVGEIGACWGGYDAPNKPWEGRFAHENGKVYPDWYLDRRPDKAGWTEAYLLLPLGIAGAALNWKI